MRYFIIIIIKSSTQQQPKYPCACNFTLIKQKRNLKLSKWGKKMYLSVMKEILTEFCMIYISLKESRSKYVSSGCFTCEILCLPKAAFPHSAVFLGNVMQITLQVSAGTAQ